MLNNSVIRTEIRLGKKPSLPIQQKIHAIFSHLHQFFDYMLTVPWQGMINPGPSNTTFITFGCLFLTYIVFPLQIQTNH